MGNIPQQAASLVDGYSSFDSTLAALVDEWKPDPVPLTTAMGDLGRALAEQADRLGSEHVRSILERLEGILADGTEEEKNAAATGFLEAMASVIDERPELRWMLDEVGHESKRYLDAWNDFCGAG